jgi:hypothetical protein
VRDCQFRSQHRRLLQIRVALLKPLLRSAILKHVGQCIETVQQHTNAVLPCRGGSTLGPGGPGSPSCCSGPPDSFNALSRWIWIAHNRVGNGDQTPRIFGREPPLPPCGRPVLCIMQPQLPEHIELHNKKNSATSLPKSVREFFGIKFRTSATIKQINAMFYLNVCGLKTRAPNSGRMSDPL